MLGTLLDVLRTTVQRTGLLDSCDASGYTVHCAPTPDGEFTVTSTAEPGLRVAELRELAETLRADGYRVRCRREGPEPVLTVLAGPSAE